MLYILNFHYVDLALRITFKPFIFNHLLKEFPEFHYNDAMINRIYASFLGNANGYYSFGIYVGCSDFFFFFFFFFI